MPETVAQTINFVRLLVTLEKREGACALFVQKSPDMFTNLPSARKILLDKFEKPIFMFQKYESLKTSTARKFVTLLPPSKFYITNLFW